MSDPFFLDTFQGSGQLAEHTSDSGYTYNPDAAEGYLVDGWLKSTYDASAFSSDTYLYLKGPALPDVSVVSIVGNFDFDWLNTTTDRVSVQVGLRRSGAEADDYGVSLQARIGAEPICHAVLPGYELVDIGNGGLGYGGHVIRITVDTSRSLLSIAIGNVPEGVHTVPIPDVQSLEGSALRVSIDTSTSPGVGEAVTYIPRANSIQMTLGEKGVFWTNITRAVETP